MRREEEQESGEGDCLTPLASKQRPSLCHQPRHDVLAGPAATAITVACFFCTEEPLRANPRASLL